MSQIIKVDAKKDKMKNIFPVNKNERLVLDAQNQNNTF